MAAAVLVATVLAVPATTPRAGATCQVTRVLGPAPATTPTTTTAGTTTTTVSSAVAAEVRCLEERLVALGYTSVGTPDGVYGPETVAAVQAFQLSRGLYPDGRTFSWTTRQLGLRGDDPLTRPVRVSLLGDSTIAAMRWYDEANNVTTRYDTIGNAYDAIFSVESCRRLVVTSCTGRIDPVTRQRWVPMSVLPLMQTSLRGRLGDVLVIMAGYDDTTIVSAIDQIMAEAMAQGVEDVFWLNYRLTNSYPKYQQYYEAHNRALLAARARHPRLTVLDWNEYSAGRTTWFEADGIHLRSLGATELGRFIRAAIDERRPAACRALDGTTATGEPSGMGAAAGVCGAARLGVYAG